MPAALEQDKVPVEPLVARQLEDQIARAKEASIAADVAPMRNRWLE